MVIPRLRELLASVSIQTAKKACEGDVGGLRRVVYCIHLPVDRTQSRDSTPRQKTWTVQARAAVKLDRFQLWQRSWLSSCFRSAGCRRQLAKKDSFPRPHQDLENQTKKKTVCSLPKPPVLAFHAPLFMDPHQSASRVKGD